MNDVSKEMMEMMEMLEMIKTMLSNLSSDMKETIDILSEFENEQTEIKDTVNELKEDTSSLKTTVAHIDGRLDKLEITLENTTNKNIQLLSERIASFTEKYNDIPKKFDELKTDVQIIKKAVTSHSNK